MGLFDDLIKESEELDKLFDEIDNKKHKPMSLPAERLKVWTSRFRLIDKDTHRENTDKLPDGFYRLNEEDFYAALKELATQVVWAAEPYCVCFAQDGEQYYPFRAALMWKYHVHVNYEREAARLLGFDEQFYKTVIAAAHGRGESGMIARLNQLTSHGRKGKA